MGSEIYLLEAHEKLGLEMASSAKILNGKTDLNIVSFLVAYFLGMSGLTPLLLQAL